MKEKLARFMVGRNGTDQLARASLTAALILLVASMLLRSSRLGSALWILALAALVYSCFRILSRNVAKRREETARFLSLSAAIKQNSAARKARYAMRKDYCFFRCPSCRTMLRVPKGKGKILVRCSKCGQAFERKT